MRRIIVPILTLATVGLSQLRPHGETELPLLTSGDDFARLELFLTPGRESYSAADVLRHLLRETANKP